MSNSEYFNQLLRAMELLSDHPKSVFMGQGMFGGTTMSDTLRDVPNTKRLEMPVAEDFQLGMATGMSLDGLLPICVFPRWNFLLCAANQLINHLDRLSLYSEYKPKVIIRTAIPSNEPFDPGPQHDDDFTTAFCAMARTINFVRLNKASMIVPAYESAVLSSTSTVLVEYTEHYKDVRATNAAIVPTAA